MPPIRFTWMASEYEIRFRTFAGLAFIQALGEAVMRDTTACDLFRNGCFVASAHSYRDPADEPNERIGRHYALKRLTERSMSQFRAAAVRSYNAAKKKAA